MPKPPPRVAPPPAEEALKLTPVAITRSCFQDKFGVPRQPGLTRYAHGELVIQPPFDREDAFRGLDTASHLWLIFQFHEAVRAEWRPVVRPPRLGGNRKMGVFASRSPFRPNSLGLSVVRNEGLRRRDGQLVLAIRDHDLIDGTPILDIKPYLPFADALPDASLGWADAPPATALPVQFSDTAEEHLTRYSQANYPDLRALIVDVLSYDPRPSFRRGRDETRIYGVHLYDLNVRFRFVTDHHGMSVEVLTVCYTDLANN